MWIARTSEYSWVLMPHGQFSRVDRWGYMCTQSTPNTIPQRGDEVHLLSGINNYGEEVIVYIRSPNGTSDAWGARYEAYKINVGCWTSISANDALKWTNLAHIREVQKRLAEEILLGQA